MKKHKGFVRPGELEKLLKAIAEGNSTIYFRFRRVGEMWQPNFMRVLRVTEAGVLLNDEIRNVVVSVTDLSQIIQFEFDAPVHKFEPHFHYDLTGGSNH